MSGHSTRRAAGNDLRGAYQRTRSILATPEGYETWLADGCRPLLGLDDRDAAIVRAYLESEGRILPGEGLHEFWTREAKAIAAAKGWVV